MLVRHLDWQESLAAEQDHSLSSTRISSSSRDNDSEVKQTDDARQTQTDLASAPKVALDDKFDIVIGTDILYEVRQLLDHDSLQDGDHETLLSHACSAIACILRQQCTPIVLTLQSCHNNSLYFAGSSLTACGCGVETSLSSAWSSSHLLCCQGSG